MLDLREEKKDSSQNKKSAGKSVEENQSQQLTKKRYIAIIVYMNKGVLSIEK